MERSGIKTSKEAADMFIVGLSYVPDSSNVIEVCWVPVFFREIREEYFEKMGEKRKNMEDEMSR